MKKAELLELLKDIPEDAEIVVAGYYCDIMGEYTFSDAFTFMKTKAYKSKLGGLKMTISNYVQEEDALVDVWELG